MQEFVPSSIRSPLPLCGATLTTRQLWTRTRKLRSSHAGSSELIADRIVDH